MALRVYRKYNSVLYSYIARLHGTIVQWCLYQLGVSVNMVWFLCHISNLSQKKGRNSRWTISQQEIAVMTFCEFLLFPLSSEIHSEVIEAMS